MNAPPKKKKTVEKQPAPAKVQQEDLTHLKAKSKDENLKINEVQDAMTNGFDKAKQDWLTPQFFEKLAKSPKPKVPSGSTHAEGPRLFVGSLQLL